MNDRPSDAGLTQSGGIEPGDLVRVIRSHCPAAWEEEQGTYFVALSGPEPLTAGIGVQCSRCMGWYPHSEKYVWQDGTYETGRWHPAAWLRKVPGLTADEVAEFLSDVLDEEKQDA